MTDHSWKQGLLLQREGVLPLAVLLAALCFLVPSRCGAEERGVAESSGGAPEARADGVVIGISGHYRVGRMTAVRMTKSASEVAMIAQARRGQIELETLDGDGVRTRYGAYPMTGESESSGTAGELGDGELGYVVPGSEAAPLAIYVDQDGRDRTVVQTRFPTAGVPSNGPSMIPPSMPWVVCIGDALGVDSIGASNVLVDKAARIAVTKIEVASRLPFQSFGYDGVDLVMINAAGLTVLRDMVPLQREALTGWLRRGGRMLVCLGESTEQMLEAAPWLSRLLPLEEVTVQRYDPAALETFTSSQTPLGVFGGVKLPRQVGRLLISGRTTRRVTAVLAAEYVVGFGQITVVTADLERAEFASWPERLELVKQIVGDLLADQSGDRENRNRATSFGDLAGQMRGVLDQFPIKPRFSFSLISVILMLLIAAIGPLDYLLINRVWGKPLLGWLSFPLIAIALSVFLVTQAAPQVNVQEVQAGPGSAGLIRANQFQVTDIDLVDGAGRGFAWCSLYSHDPMRVDIDYSAVESIDRISDAEGGNPRSYAFPMGYPGREFGGIQLAGENTVFSGYSVRPRNMQANNRPGVETEIREVTLAPRSSKAFATRVLFSADRDNVVGVTRRPGSELLRGAFVNPLPVDVLDGVLIYGNWVYLLPTRIPAGSSIAELNELRQKNFRWRLTRQQSAENVTETTPWSSSDFSDVGRVAEIMMFHRSAGGELYTGLRHDVTGDLDLSDVLVEDRCILVGRTEEPMFDLKVSNSTDDSQAIIRPDGSILSMVRVILPVRSSRLN